jgi:hypothetical protein
MGTPKKQKNNQVEQRAYPVNEKWENKLLKN